MNGMTSRSAALAGTIWSALGGEASALGALSFTQAGALPSVFRVTDLAAASIGAAALAVAALIGRAGSPTPAVTVDRRLAAIWFLYSLRPIGWALPPPWDPVAGDYAARDGWIRLHTNAPHHRAAALRVLGTEANRAAVTEAVADWDKGELEAAIVAAGGCAAEMRSADAWAIHPQGRAVATEKLVHVAATEAGPPMTWRPAPERPLRGLRVLDLTRVLAGPVATRFLAGFGAEILRLDPPGWDEPGVVPEVTLGKRCARLDLRTEAGRAIFEGLLRRADVLVHGYRPGALDRLGYDPARRRALSPGLIDVSLSAYGWSGPWAGRRGFDSLVQVSAGIAEAGMHAAGGAKPTPLPVQALDHATGYLMAAAALQAVSQRLETGQGADIRLSLARTAGLLMDQGEAGPEPAFAPESPDDLGPEIERTGWGDARRIRPPAVLDGIAVRWSHSARELGTDAAAW